MQLILFYYTRHVKTIILFDIILLDNKYTIDNN